MMKTALILADDERGLEKVYGIPAVRRLVLLARLLRFDRLLVFSRDTGLLPVVSDVIEGSAFHHAADGSDLYSAIRKLQFSADELVLVLKANHVVDRWSLDRLLQAGQDHEISLLEKDEKSSAEAVFLVKASCLSSLLASLQTNELPACIGADAVHVQAGSGLPELLNGGREKRRAAEAGLTFAVGKATWARDSLLYRHASRHISRLISSRIARTAITANMVTLVNAVVGLAGAFLLSLGDYLPQLAGSFVFLFSTIVDLVDGEVARLKLQESNFGHYFDIICDNVVHVAIFIGIAFGLFRETGSAVFLHLLWLFMGGLILCAFILNRILAEHRAGLQPSRLAVRLEALFNNRDFAYLITFLAIFHRLDWFFVASAFGAYLLAGILWVTRLVSRPAAGRTVHG